MKIEREEKPSLKRILFVDFNGVISYNTFWYSIRNHAHPLNPYYDSIKDLLFRGDNKIVGLVDDWMLGKHTSEEIHQIIAIKTGAPYQSLFDIFCSDCRQIDISISILNKIQTLRKNWYCILRTDNMDTLRRFTMPANPILARSFDEIQCSYEIGTLKRDNGGGSFLATVSNLGSSIKNSVIIDDSQSTCKLFESLGGKSYCTQNETEALTALNSLAPPRSPSRTFKAWP